MASPVRESRPAPTRRPELMCRLGSLEGLAARRTEELGDERRRQVVDDLRSRNTRPKQIAESDTAGPTRFFDIDAELHCDVVDARGGGRVLTLHGSFWLLAERYFCRCLKVQQYSFDRSVAEHDDMIEAIATGDPDVAETAVTRT